MSCVISVTSGAWSVIRLAWQAHKVTVVINCYYISHTAVSRTAATSGNNYKCVIVFKMLLLKLVLLLYIHTWNNKVYVDLKLVMLTLLFLFSPIKACNPW